MPWRARGYVRRNDEEETHDARAYSDCCVEHARAVRLQQRSFVGGGIREGLSGELDTIVNKKGDDWDEMISDIEDEADLSQFGIDAEEFVNVLFDGFDYEITSVDVDEEDDTAVAHVTLTSKSMKDVMTALQQAADDFMGDPNNYAGLSEDELYKKVGELMMDAIRGVETQNVDVDLECERDEDGNWTEADSVADEITNALMS